MKLVISLDEEQLKDIERFIKNALPFIVAEAIKKHNV